MHDQAGSAAGAGAYLREPENRLTITATTTDYEKKNLQLVDRYRYP